MLSTTLPDGRIVSYGYDADGNLTSVTPPGRPAHDFAYNVVGLLSSYTPPAVSGTGATNYRYNLDRDLTTIIRPDGETINYNYDTAGRVSSITVPTGTSTYTYNSTTGNLVSAANDIENIAYSYNGPLPAGSAWTGTVAGSVSRTYNSNFWVISQSVDGTNTVTFQYDNDGLLTAAGPLTLSRSPSNGLISETSLGVVMDTRKYNGFGEPMTYIAMVKGAPVYSFEFARDGDGRITTNTETIGGAANFYTYGYDAAGRLASATKNAATDTYTFDANSNRLSETTPSGTTRGTSDAQDRLLTYGNASYTYTGNGELASQSIGSQKTTYTYDVLGNLIAVNLPNGTKINYLVDPEGRRIGKKVNGVLIIGLLYDGARVVAQLNGSNQIVSQFVYATGTNAPDYMIKGGTTYRIFCDQLGSPRVVVNTSTGAIVEQISYDEFGNVISDTNPGFQPFGFAGGLYDADVKLLRFGARDYNASIGRWTSKDPILFRSGDSNSYGYTLNNPVNLIDPEGLQAETCVCGPVPWVNYTPGPASSSPSAPKAIPFVNYTPGSLDLDPFGPIMNPFNVPLTSAVSPQESIPTISANFDDYPLYDRRQIPSPQECWRRLNNMGGLFGKPRNFPNPGDFNPGGPSNPTVEGEQVEPRPDYSETVVEPVEAAP